MKHHYNQPDSKFLIKPSHFDKYTDISMLRFCLGATMYMPGTRDFHNEILTKKYPGLTSFVLCLKMHVKLNWYHRLKKMFFTCLIFLMKILIKELQTEKISLY